METAVPSDSVVRTFKKIEENQPTAEDVAQKADADIGQLSFDPRWKAFKEVIDGMIAAVERVETIDVTDTPAQIGFKFMVSRLTASQLKLIRDLPDTIAQGAQDGGTETT